MDNFYTSIDKAKQLASRLNDGQMTDVAMQIIKSIEILSEKLLDEIDTRKEENSELKLLRRHEYNP